MRVLFCISDLRKGGAEKVLTAFCVLATVAYMIISIALKGPFTYPDLKPLIIAVLIGAFCARPVAVFFSAQVCKVHNSIWISPCQSAFVFLFSMGINLSILFWIWTTGEGRFNSIGGLLPYSDAREYFCGAHALIEWGSLTELASRRPLASGAYAVMLKLSGQNLQLSLLWITIAASLGIWRASEAIRRYFGLGPALIMVFLLSKLFSPFNGQMLTEQIGFLIGCSAFALLMTGIAEKKRVHWYWGVFLIGLALSCRAGAFVIIPCLVVLGGWVEKNKRSYNFRIAGICLLLATASLAVSPVLLRVIGAPGGYQYQGNFAYSLYGLVRGGLGWEAFGEEHPEIANSLSLSDGEMSKKAYRCAYEEIKRRPSCFISGIAKQYKATLFDLPAFLFPFSLRIHKRAWMESALMVLVAIGLTIGALRRAAQEDFSIVIFLGISVAGIIASAPFLSDGGFRVYAATFPMNAALVAVSAGMYLRFGQKGQKKMLQAASMLDIKIALVAAAVIILGPVGVKLLHPKLDSIKALLSGNDACIVFRHCPGSMLRIVDGQQKTFLPEVSLQACRSNYACAIGGVAAGQLDTGMCLYCVVNLAGAKPESMYLMLDTEIKGAFGRIAIFIPQSSAGKVYRGQITGFMQ